MGYDFVFADEDEKRIIEELKKEAAGIRSAFHSRGLSGVRKTYQNNAPKPNTRFLDNLVRSTESHNRVKREASKASPDSGEITSRKNNSSEKLDGKTKQLKNGPRGRGSSKGMLSFEDSSSSHRIKKDKAREDLQRRKILEKRSEMKSAKISRAWDKEKGNPT